MIALQHGDISFLFREGGTYTYTESRREYVLYELKVKNECGDVGVSTDKQ